MAIQKTSNSEVQEIRARSATALPDRPKENGMTTAEVKEAFVAPIIGSEHSILTELDRVVDELNAVLEGSQGTDTTLATSSQTLIGAINELRGKLTRIHDDDYPDLQTRAQTVLEAINELKSEIDSNDDDIETKIGNAVSAEATARQDGDASNRQYVDDAGFLKNIGFYNNLVPTASQSVSEVIIDGVTYYTLGGLSDVKAGYAYYVAAVNNIDYWDTFVCLQVVNGTALFWPFRTISGSVPNNLTARKHVFVIDENGKNDTIKYSVDPHAGTGYRSIMQRDADGRSQVNDPAANLDVANKQWTLAQISSLGTVFNVKGTVATVSALPASGNSVGDVYFVTADNSEYVWTSSNAWEQFGPTIDINGAIDSRLNNYYDIFGSGQQLILGKGQKNTLIQGNQSTQIVNYGSNGISLYDVSSSNELDINSNGILLTADYKFNISAAGGEIYVRTDDGMDLHLYGLGGVQVDRAFRIESDSPDASPFHYDSGCIQMCNGQVYLDYATNSNYTTNTFNIAIPNLYKTFNQNTMQYSNPYATASDVSAAVANMVTTNTSQTINAIKQFRASSGQYKFFVGVEDEEGDGIPETYSQFRIYQNGYQFHSLNSTSSGSTYSNRTTKVNATPSLYEITATEAPDSPGYYIKLDMDSNYLLGDIGYIDHWHNRVSNITWQDGDLTLYGEQAIAVGVGSGDLLVNLEPTQIDVVIGTEMELRIDNNGMYADFDGSSGNYFQMGRTSNSVDIVIGDDPTNSNKTYNVTLRGTNIDIEADTKIVADKLYKSYTSASVNNPYVDKQTYDSLVARVAALESALSIQNS